jgi:hypothetical protein
MAGSLPLKYIPATFTGVVDKTDVRYPYELYSRDLFSRDWSKLAGPFDSMQSAERAASNIFANTHDYDREGLALVRYLGGDNEQYIRMLVPDRARGMADWADDKGYSAENPGPRFKFKGLPRTDGRFDPAVVDTRAGKMKVLYPSAATEKDAIRSAKALSHYGWHGMMGDERPATENPGNPAGDFEDSKATGYVGTILKTIERDGHFYDVMREHHGLSITIRRHDDGDLTAVVKDMNQNQRGPEVVLTQDQIQDVYHYALHHGTMEGWRPDSHGVRNPSGPVNRKMASPLALAKDYKARGLSRSRAWSEFVKDRSLSPGMDAKDFYRYYDMADAELLRGEEIEAERAPYIDPEFADYGKRVSVIQRIGRHTEEREGTIYRTLTGGSGETVYEVDFGDGPHRLPGSAEVKFLNPANSYGIPTAEFRAMSARDAGRHLVGRHKSGTGEFRPGARNPVRNPEPAAAALYETFHGSPSTETLEITQDIHYHGHLTVLGDLVELKVNTFTGKQATISFSADDPEGSTKLCSNESGTQLYIEGGDQSLDLTGLGFNKAQSSKDHVAVGVLFELTYRAKKQFQKFKLTDYYHGLGEETGYEPILNFDTMNQSMTVSGGEYQVKAEGIVN